MIRKITVLLVVICIFASLNSCTAKKIDTYSSSDSKSSGLISSTISQENTSSSSAGSNPAASESISTISHENVSSILSEAVNSATVQPTSNGSQISPTPDVQKYDNSRRPRKVSSENPLFNFKTASWSVVPDDLKKNSAMVYDGSRIENLDFDALKENKIPIIIQCENWNSWERPPVVAVSKLEELFKKHDNIIGVSFVEQGCGVLNDIQLERMIETIKLCGKYKALFIWEDGAANNLNIVFGIAGQNSELFNTIKANKDYIIFINKMVGAMQHFLNQSLIMGFWLSDLCTAWGINSEDFYWWESGFGPRYQDTKGWKYYGLDGMARSRYCIPDSLIGQMVALAMVQGGSVFSFENVDRVVCNGMTLLPIYEKVIHPLETLAQNGGIPSKEQVRSRIKVVYHADDWNSVNIKLPGEELFRGLYGCNQYTDSFISTNKTSPEFIPYDGRYFNLPVIPTLGKSDAAKYFSKILDSKTLLSNKKEYFDSQYAKNASGSSCVMDVANIKLITNPHENSNIESIFDDVSICSGKYKLGGKLQPFNYIYAIENKGEIMLHINNFTIDSDTAVWNNPEFDPTKFLIEYMKPDCKWASTQRTTIISIKGLSSTAKIDTSSGNVSKTINGNITTLTIKHNGPVYITVKY